MGKEYVMGNGAIALGALAAGINLATGYPGTPSSEIIETISKHNKGGIHVEWSVNEKAAMEVAASAAFSGARALVTMKQVGLNVAADPLLSLAYVGVEGGMVVVSADDPGPISSQTEQDTRAFADFARIPVFDPSSPEEAYHMIQDAFVFSEKYHTPVLFRPTTRVCHSYAQITFPDSFTPKVCRGFAKDANKWVIFPRLSYTSHKTIEERNPEIGRDFSEYRYNLAEGKGRLAVFASGISYSYTKECIDRYPGIRLIKISTPHPFPEDFVLKNLEGVDEVLCIEELSPYIEDHLLALSGKYHLNINIYGRHTGHIPHSGENSTDIVISAIEKFYHKADKDEHAAACVPTDNAVCPTDDDRVSAPKPPARPPVLCAGCPHRAAFYAVKEATKGKKCYYCGDIGCYTLGNAAPLDMVDTCLCMGAGITMAQGFSHTDPDSLCFAFVGDSTFFASGMTGMVNAVYNEANITLCVLDNSTTAMTGHQPHPGTGINMMGDVVGKISIEKILDAIGVEKVITVDPFDLEKSIDAVKECIEINGVKAIIFKAPCIAVSRPYGKITISDKCIMCKKCIRETGCPALVLKNDKIYVDEGLCTGCGLCKNICPVHAICLTDNVTSTDSVK